MEHIECPLAPREITPLGTRLVCAGNHRLEGIKPSVCALAGASFTIKGSVLSRKRIVCGVEGRDLTQARTQLSAAVLKPRHPRRKSTVKINAVCRLFEFCARRAAQSPRKSPLGSIGIVDQACL
ncbi:hypothetical protein EPN42_01510 [bacterium]|nr:MAG: hypothetical protein EPN42_01510 [bacterium]